MMILWKLIQEEIERIRINATWRKKKFEELREFLTSLLLFEVNNKVDSVTVWYEEFKVFEITLLPNSIFIYPRNWHFRTYVDEHELETLIVKHFATYIYERGIKNDSERSEHNTTDSGGPKG